MSRENKELNKKGREHAAWLEQRERTLTVYGGDLVKIADFEARYGHGPHWLESVPQLRDLGLIQRVPTPDNLDATWNLTNQGRSELKTRFPDYTPPPSRVPVSGLYVWHTDTEGQAVVTLMRDSRDRNVALPAATFQNFLDTTDPDEIIAHGLTIDPEDGTVTLCPPTG